MREENSLLQIRKSCESLYKEYNNTTEFDQEKRIEIYKKLFGKFGSNLSIRAPFYCELGKNIFLGDGVYMNFNCSLIDNEEIHIGNLTLLAPNVLITTQGKDGNKKVTIGNSVWIGGGVIILPGVTIGDNSVIGAGSVVTENIEANCVAAGNPCRVIRKIEV